MAWLRLDEHIPENRKVQSLPPELFKMWVNLLCIAKATDGRLENLDQIGFRLRLRWKTFLAGLESLSKSGLLDKTHDALGDVYSVHDWDDWQYKSDVSTGRVKRFRKRDMKRSAPFHETPRSDAATAASASGSGSLEVKPQEQKSASRPPNGHHQPPQFGGDYPLTIEEIRKHDAAVDDFFVARLVKQVTQYCMSHKHFPQHELSFVTDKTIAKACAESYATKPKNHGTGLLLSRVPAIIVSWSLER